MNQIPFNKPFLTGKELIYIQDAVNSGKISGNGKYTKLCQTFFEENFKIKKALLTTSCTDALEMCAILADIKSGDEVIVPSYTFVSTAIAFIRQGAKIIFADSGADNPNINPEGIEHLITEKTKAIVPVHYAGVACDMDKINQLASKYQLTVVEDAAQAIDSYYKGSPLGTIGDLGAFSFHETKNIISGEGGLLAVNNMSMAKRSEIIWEKGTNRAEFFRGEVNKYGWVDIGSSFLPSEVISAFLYAQLENLKNIQDKRIKLWEFYHDALIELEEQGHIKLPSIPDFATNNAHMFYILCNDLEERTRLISHLKNNCILSVFHYLSLHQSEFYKAQYQGPTLINSDMYENCLLRLPLYYELSFDELTFITDKVKEFYIK